MARKQGGVNKFLNFIGLVDAEPQTAVDDYADNYGRPSTYVPKQQRSRTEDTRRRSRRERFCTAPCPHSGWTPCLPPPTTFPGKRRRR